MTTTDTPTTVPVTTTSTTKTHVEVLGFKAKANATNGGALYSNHDCRGTPISGYYGVHPNRTCRFQDVCYDLSSNKGNLLYFHNGTFDTDVPKSLDLRAFSGPGNGPVNLEVQLVPKRIPDQVAVFRNPVAVLSQPFGSENFGHTLADSMYGVYFMQWLFRIADPLHSQLLTLSSCDSFSDDGMDRSVCKKMMPKMYAAISRLPVLQLDLLQTHDDLIDAPLNGSHLLCFRTLLVSPGANSFRAWGMGWALGRPHLYWDFRRQMVQNMLGPHCPDVACGSVAPAMSRIIVLVKTGVNRADSPYTTGPGIQNSTGIQEHLASRFPKYIVECVDAARFSMKDQISMMTQTAVLFSHAGGGGFVSLFLPHGATLALRHSIYYWELTFFKTLWLFVCEFPNLSPSLAERIVRKKPQQDLC